MALGSCVSCLGLSFIICEMGWQVEKEGWAGEDRGRGELACSTRQRSGLHSVGPARRTSLSLCPLLLTPLLTPRRLSRMPIFPLLPAKSYLVSHADPGTDPTLPFSAISKPSPSPCLSHSLCRRPELRSCLGVFKRCFFL